MKTAATEQANRTMTHIVGAIGVGMGFKDSGNDKAYLDIIRVELGLELIMIQHALEQFYERHPNDPYLGMETQS